MIGLGLLGKVADLAGTMIEGKTAVKQAEAQTKMKIATGELDWDLAAMKAQRIVGKTSGLHFCSVFPLFWRFVGIGVMLLCKAGFAHLSNMPGWYQYSLGGIVSASLVCVVLVSISEVRNEREL